MTAPKVTAAQLQEYVDFGYTPAQVAEETGADISNVSKRMKKIKPAKLPHNLTPSNAKGYVVTSAQNDSRVHGRFLSTLEAYCDRHGYQLVVVPIRYRNPTTPREGSAPQQWAASVAPYLSSEDVQLCHGLKLMGSVPTQPTAVRPLSGLDTITGQDCGIFGHPKVALTPVATRQGKIPKLLYTTGSVTSPNYSASKAGRKGEFHHVMGAVVVQRDGDLFHIRNIHAQSDGSFYDLDCKYHGATVTTGHRAAVLTPGDIHAAIASPDALKSIKRVAKLLRPKRIVAHDVLDFGSASHHSTFFEKFANRHAGKDCIHDELKTTAKVMDYLAGLADEMVMVASNHNDHFTKWLESDKNANDLTNAWIYAETRAYYLRQLMDGKEPASPLEFWAKRMCKSVGKIRFLRRNESYMVGGVEHSYHGDKGPGGARGSTMNLSKIGVKSTKGHDHKAEIIDGCYSGGTTSILDPRYTRGSPSAWIHSMVVQYMNGKRTHVHTINGRCGV